MRRSLLLDSTYSAGYQELALILLKEGRSNEAVASMERSIRLEGPNPFAGDLGVLGYVYGVSGKRNRALGILNDLDSLARHEYVDSAAKGFVWLGLRDRDRAFHAFQISVRSGGSLLLDYFPSDPMFDPLRVDPRFDSLLRSVGLPVVSTQSTQVLSSKP